MSIFRKHRTALLYGGMLLAATATAALAGNGIGGVFNLGQVNTVNTPTRLEGTTTSRQLWVRNASTSTASVGVAGIATGGIGVWGQSDRRMGVRAFATGTSGTNYGLYATTPSADGLAGYFENLAPGDLGGTALLAVSNGTAADIPNRYGDPAGAFVGYNGVLGVSAAGSGNGFGVVGHTSEQAGAGVHAAARSSTGSAYGLWAVSSSETGLAGYFQNTNTRSDLFGTALRAISEGSASDIPTAFSGAGEFVGHIGVVGVATPSGNGGYGAAGFATGPNGIGVLGHGAAYGIYSDGHAHVQGNLHVTGTITKGTNNFKIDHPLDPANKYLSHSVVELPDMKNVYDGNVVTDVDGVAVVELPSYFEALNRDPRYQLTVIGSFADAQIAEEIADNRFTIMTEEPNVKVSWQVTGIRQDAFAEAHPIVVEEEKAVADRGRYLHPAEHGQPETMGIGTHVAAQAGTDVPSVQ